MTARVLVGTAGWSYADWAGRVYPDPAPRGFDGLRHLARFLDCLEINSTFYRVPSPRTVADWVRRTDGLPGFLFTAKVHRSFTHGDDADTGPADARAFLDALAPLREAGRLGALLLQFPWSFRDSPDARRRLPSGPPMVEPHSAGGPLRDQRAWPETVSSAGASPASGPGSVRHGGGGAGGAGSLGQPTGSDHQ